MAKVNANVSAVGSELTLFSNGEPFDIPRGSQKGSRSIMPSIPIEAYVGDNMLELDFMAPIGDIEVTISRNGRAVYSSTETISMPISKVIQLSHMSGNFLLEIKGANGAYAYAQFKVGSNRR
ncbi:MAG: DUF3244 domain-containing protein [Bacteroides sp.]|nr:DUF3244 domain-containing protein [Bacteroides sp.]